MVSPRLLIHHPMRLQTYLQPILRGSKPNIGKILSPELRRLYRRLFSDRDLILLNRINTLQRHPTYTYVVVFYHQPFAESRIGRFTLDTTMERHEAILTNLHNNATSAFCKHGKCSTSNEYSRLYNSHFGIGCVRQSALLIS